MNRNYARASEQFEREHLTTSNRYFGRHLIKILKGNTSQYLGNIPQLRTCEIISTYGVSMMDTLRAKGWVSGLRGGVSASRMNVIKVTWYSYKQRTISENYECHFVSGKDSRGRPFVIYGFLICPAKEQIKTCPFRRDGNSIEMVKTYRDDGIFFENNLIGFGKFVFRNNHHQSASHSWRRGLLQLFWHTTPLRFPIVILCVFYAKGESRRFVDVIICNIIILMNEGWIFVFV